MSLPVVAEPLPTSISFGKVVGRVVHLIADTAEDTDDKPQARAAAGKVTFAPKDVLRKTTDVDYPAIVLHAPETATLSSSGRILDAEGRQGIWLAVGIYTVTFSINGAARAIPSFDIAVTGEHTDATPLDLATVVPYVPPTGTVVQTVVVPSGGTEGQVLVRTADGGLVWADQTGDVEVAGYFQDETSVTFQAVDGLVAGLVAAGSGTQTEMELRAAFAPRDSLYVRDFLTAGATAAANRTALQTAIDTAGAAGKDLCFDQVDVRIAGGHVTVTHDGMRLWSSDRAHARVTQETRPRGVFRVEAENVTVEQIHMDGDNPTLDMTSAIGDNRVLLSYGVKFGPGAHGGRVLNCSGGGLFRVVFFECEETPDGQTPDAGTVVLLRDVEVDGLDVQDCFAGLMPVGVERAHFRNIRGSYKKAIGNGADPHLIYMSAFALSDTAPVYFNKDVQIDDCLALDGEVAGPFVFRHTKGLRWSNLSAVNCNGLIDCIDIFDWHGGDGCTATNDVLPYNYLRGVVSFLLCGRGVQQPVYVTSAAGQRNAGVSVRQCTDVDVIRPRIVLDNTGDTSGTAMGAVIVTGNVRCRIIEPNIRNLGGRLQAGVLFSGGSGITTDDTTVLDPIIRGDFKWGIRVATANGTKLFYTPSAVESFENDVAVDSGVTAAVVNRSQGVPTRAQALVTARGLLSENFSPLAAGTSTPLTGGLIYLLAVGVVAGDVITHIPVAIQNAGTAGGQTLAKVGLYDSSGNRLAISANQGSAWETAGLYSVPLLAPYTVPASGVVYVAYLATNTTTNVAMLRSIGNTVATNPLNSGVRLSASGGTGQTDLPATVTIAGGQTGYWAGLIGTSAA